MADVDTADIGPHLAAAYEFIETAMAGKKGETTALTYQDMFAIICL